MSRDTRAPDLLVLLEAERKRPNAPDAVKAAARAQLAALFGPGSGLGGPPGNEPPRSTPAGEAPRGGGASSSAGRALSSGSAAAGYGKLILAFVLGGAAATGAIWALGDGLHARSAPSSAPTSAPEPTAEPHPAATPWQEVPPPPSSAPSPWAEHATPAPVATGARPTVAPKASEPTAAVGDHSLAGERSLLERARSALARGDATQALAAVGEHAQRYPAGQLAEEREALAIQALVSAGRRDEAAERAGRFRIAHPGSLLLPVVDEALR